MRVLVTGRQAGKTTRIITMLRANPEAVLVVATAMRADTLRKEHPNLANQIVSCNTNLRGRKFSKMYVDDVDQVLANLLRLCDKLWNYDSSSRI